MPSQEVQATPTVAPATGLSDAEKRRAEILERMGNKGFLM